MMEKYKKMPCLLLLAMLFFGTGQNVLAMQKVLVIVETNAYWATYYNIGQYLNDIAAYDHKKAELIVWDFVEGSNYYQCLPLWHRLQDEYFAAINDGDILEGAVLIGNVPVPQQDPVYGYLPLDQIYMDIVDMGTGQPQQYSPNTTPFKINYGGYFTTDYGTFPGCPPGDHIYDVWVSRINAQYLSGGIRQGWNYLDEYAVYNNYLTKLHARMTAPATVPSRGFAMGGIQVYDFHGGLGQYFQLLNLPWFAEYTGGHNSSFNWMSQLLAGPRGCINYGACNSTLFPNERNRRYCIYSQLPVVYFPGNPNPSSNYNIPNYQSDSLGWEWAGVYGHSTPELTDYHSAGDGCNYYNGRFIFGTFGPYWASPSSSYWVNNGINGGHYWYEDNDNNPNPYSRGHGWKSKRGQWRWNLTADNTYDIYAYYQADANNCNFVCYYLYEMTRDGNGVPLNNVGGHYVQIDPPPAPPTWVPYWGISIDQRTHVNPLNPNPGNPDYNWECIFSGISLHNGNMAIVYSPADFGYHPLAPDGGNIIGHQIVDAVKYRVSGADVATIDDADPAYYPDNFNQPYPIFSTAGFHTDDEVDRAYEDMGDEPGGGGNSKSQFFLTKACDINNFIYTTPLQTQGNSAYDPNLYNGTAITKNLGNLYALGHNGLVCLGTVGFDWPSEEKGSFTSALANGKDFGEAYLAKINNFDLNTIYALLGAGSLHSQPYIQYGSSIYQDMTITTTQSITTPNPILIKNVTVNGNGNWTVTSSYNSNNSPPGTHSEIVVRPETDFAPTGSNVVHLVAN